MSKSTSSVSQWNYSVYDPTKSKIKFKSKETTAGGSHHRGLDIFSHQVQTNLGSNFKYVSAANDLYHKGKKSFHTQGLAKDYVLNDWTNYEAQVQQMRAMLNNAGLKEGVDYNLGFEGTGKKNRNDTVSTGNHIHFNFRSNDAANRFANWNGQIQQKPSSINPNQQVLTAQQTPAPTQTPNTQLDNAIPTSASVMTQQNALDLNQSVFGNSYISEREALANRARINKAVNFHDNLMFTYKPNIDINLGRYNG